MRIIPILKFLLGALILGWLLSIAILRFRLGSSSSPTTLKQIVVITRHGDRSPIHTKIGNSPHCEEMSDRWAFWGEQLPSAENLEFLSTLHEPNREISDKDKWPYGQLTKRGAQQLKKTGETLRKMYIENERLLPDTLDSSVNIVLRATSRMRTVQSAQNLMAGLYPPEKRANGTFLPIKVRNPKDENMFPSGCDRERHLISQLGSKGVGEITDKYEKDFRDMCDIEGEVPWSPLRDLMHCRSVHGLALPVAFGKVHLEALETINAKRRVVWYAENDILRLAIGRFLRDILSAITDIESDEIISTRKPTFTLFSGHDTTLLPVMAALGALNTEKWPDYASYIVIEVYAASTTRDGKTDNQSVRVLFNNQALSLPFCSGEYCALADLIAKFSPLIPENYAKECKNIPVS